MRRSQLKKLVKGLQQLQRISFKDSRELVLKLGEAKGRYRNAWRLLDVSLPDANATSFSFRLNRDKLAQARRREGHYLLRTTLCTRDPDA